MLQTERYIKLIFLLFTVVFISNCGGGGNNSNKSTSTDGASGNLTAAPTIATDNNETNTSLPPNEHTPQIELSEMVPHLAYPNLWNYDQINLHDALAYVDAATPSASKVRIAIIDMGRTEHPDIHWARENGQIIDADFSQSHLVPPNPNPNPIDLTKTHKHSTHVAGIIGGFNFQGQNRVGMCPDCEILSIKVNRGEVVGANITLEALIDGIDFAVAHHAHVINMSLAYTADNLDCAQFPSLQDAINRAIAAGSTVVASVGNYGSDTVDPTTMEVPKQFDASNSVPASCTGVISVGASDQSGDLAIRYSNKGSAIIGVDGQPQLDANGRALSTMTLIAPGGGAEDKNGVFGMGVDCPEGSVLAEVRAGKPVSTSSLGIFSTHYVDNPTTACYRYLSGTSMAAPHVSGVIGLMLSVQSGLSPQQIKDILIQTATDLSNKPHCGTEAGYCGAGLLNAYDAVLVASTTIPTLPPAPASNGPCAFALANTTCTIDAIAYNTVGSSDSTEEVVLAYGKRWKYSTTGDVLEAAIDLKEINYYGANTTIGPCSGLFSGQQCTIDSITILNHDALGYVESITAGSSAWNFDQGGNQWPNGASNFSLDMIDRYATGPCSGAVDECLFDTRTLTDARNEWGDYIESITANGRYYIYGFAGNFIESDLLTNVKRYGTNGFVIGGSMAGPCSYAPAGEECHFDAREFKRVGGKLIEVIVAYGRYWEFEDQKDLPLVAGTPLENIARFK